ncbi:MAG: DNA primase [Patescibacteria group bacterium]|jgi:DNA primase
MNIEVLEEIKKRVDIIDFLGRYITLKRTGQNFKALCPFHSEKTPSFVVSPDRQIWHCFGTCGEGGDVFKFLMKWDNVSFPEAVEILAKEVGVTIKLDTAGDKVYDQKRRLFAINELASDFFHFIFEKHAVGEKAREYIAKRSVSTSTIRLFKLGYSPQSWDSLLKFLLKKGYSHEEINAAGLIIKTQDGRYYDRFRGRLMFPLRDIRGNILGFSGRILVPKDTDAKYINTPETTIYHKRENLFAIDKAHQAIRKNNEIILMEGEFDVMLAHQYSYPNAVAIKGSALTQEHLRLIKRLTNRIVFSLDMDPAGNEAVKRGIEEAEHFDFEMEAIQIEGGKDPADVFATDPGQFKAFYKHRVPIYEFLIGNALRKHDITSVYGKKEAIEEMVPYLYNIFNPILIEHYVKMLSEKTNTTPDAIKKTIDTYRRNLFKKRSFTPTAQKTVVKKQEDMVEDYLLAMLLQTNETQEILNTVSTHLIADDFHSAAAFLLIQEIRKAFGTHKDRFKEALDAQVPAPLVDLYNKAMLVELPAGEVNWKKEISTTVLGIKRKSLKKQIKEGLVNDENKAAMAMKTLKEVEKALSIV